MSVTTANPPSSVGGARTPSDGYKWIALSNTTLGVLIATINASILLISLPDIFKGIDINPLLPSNTNYLLWLLLGIFLEYFGVSEPFPNRVAKAGVLTNLVLLAFNLLPIPPMDGGRIVFSLLPNKLAYKYAKIEPYGFFILLGLMLLKLLAYWVVPIMAVANLLLQLIVYPLNLVLG